MQLLVIENDQDHLLSLDGPANLLALLRDHKILIPAPCGGQGTCGKCLVTIEGIGPLLACQTVLEAALWQRAGLAADQPLVVRVPQADRPQITTDGQLPDLILSPLVVRETVRLAPPSLDDQRSDEQRLADAGDWQVPFQLLAQLPDWIRQEALTLEARLDTRTLLRLLPAQAPSPLGLAVDIGTTTMAGYLCDLNSGALLASDALINPQQAYGADVISRIEAAMAGQAQRLRQLLAEAIGSLAQRLTLRAGLDGSQGLDAISQVVLTGNTVMMHLLAGLPADAIARTPFIPVSVSARTVSAGQLGLPLQPQAVCQLMPAIAAYVGADVTAGLVATGLARQTTGTALLVDIGTNGEMVLVNGQAAVACSTAAGPAFEAANIACGLGGVRGAIDRVWLDQDQLAFSVIGQADGALKPAGICGSGLVSAVAACLSAGLIDETGRINDQPDSLPAGLSQHIQQLDGRPVICLSGRVDQSRPVYLSQKDIRELQNAKAALAAGILLLLEASGLQTEAVDEVIIAGGFGQHLVVADALAIGLLPKAFAGRIRFAGNTAGMGALACLIQQSLFYEAIESAGRVRYLELSAQTRFSDLYIDAMLFPEQS